MYTKDYQEWLNKRKERSAAEKADFDRRCEIVRSTPITQEMTYKERFEMQLKRYGV
jgi:hypothetical protein